MPQVPGARRQAAKQRVCESPDPVFQLLPIASTARASVKPPLRVERQARDRCHNGRPIQSGLAVSIRLLQFRLEAPCFEPVLEVTNG
jgi:hypothetical protein